MADRDDVRALEALTPWDRPAFRVDLALLSVSVADAARAFAADAAVLSRLASQVPRCANDESGATPWTSFRSEVAVATRSTPRMRATSHPASSPFSLIFRCVRPSRVIHSPRCSGRPSPTGSVTSKAFALLKLASKGCWSANPAQTYRNMKRDDFWHKVKPSALGGERAIAPKRDVRASTGLLT